MPLSTSFQQSASIVDLAAFRSPRFLSDRGIGPRSSAELLSMRQSLSYEASVEIDNLDLLCERLEPAIVNSTRLRVRRLLDREFGRLRVHRSRNNFVARHRSVEPLIAGLLRVQFYAQQIRLPETDCHGERVDPLAISVTWGVGQSGPEAASERMRRRSLKHRR